ncbi:MAG: SPFH domain-containing protein [Myxococcota bacterium]
MFEFMVSVGLAAAVGAAAAVVAGWLVVGIRYIPHQRVGVVERYWSTRGSLADGRIVALNGEAGFQADVVRGGLHFGYSPLQYRIHLQPLVTVPQGELGYVYARDGEPLGPTVTLGRVAPSNDFQDARAFLSGGGQRGRQRAILREGVYAVNLAQFVVLTRAGVYTGPQRAAKDEYQRWHDELAAAQGFAPLVVGGGAGTDEVGVVTVHDGPALDNGEIIAPQIASPRHACFQDPEQFLTDGGRRGKQLQVLTDGTYFLNRWFASVELHPKTVVPIGYVGVVVSYHGQHGVDVTGDRFRHGEQVETGQRGVWKRALTPGKYALNPYAQRVEIVPTVNFVLRWVTGQTEAHQYDKDLSSIELITADGFEPRLPLSLVLHIDYEKAPRVVQRFGDVKRLISQTLDPILSAYFRDVAQSCHMLDLLTRREEIQTRATEELGRRFRDYDINCVSVMIGRPSSAQVDGEDPIESLFDQLRQRRLAEEQIATFRQQEDAAVQLRGLRRVEAEAAKQTELTEAALDVEVTASRADAELERVRRQAKGDVERAQGEARAKEIRGRADAFARTKVGLAEAAVALSAVRAMGGDPRLVAVQRVAEALAASHQPLVPERTVTLGGGDGAQGPLQQLLQLLVTERAEHVVDSGDLTELDRLIRRTESAGSEPAERHDDLDLPAAEVAT